MLFTKLSCLIMWAVQTLNLWLCIATWNLLMAYYSVLDLCLLIWVQQPSERLTKKSRKRTYQQHDLTSKSPVSNRPRMPITHLCMAIQQQLFTFPMTSSHCFHLKRHLFGHYSTWYICGWGINVNNLIIKLIIICKH